MINLKGYIIMIFSMISHIIGVAIIKKYNISLIYKIILSNLGICIPCFIILYLYYNKKKEEESEKFNIKDLFSDKNRLTIGILYSFYMIFLYYGYTIIPISVAIPIFMISPILIMIFSKYINNKSFNILELISSLISFIGIIIVCFSKSKINNNTLFQGIICMIIAALLYSFSIVLLDISSNDRKLFKYFAYQENIDKSKRSIFEEVNIQLLSTSLIPLLIGILGLIIIKVLPNKYIPLAYQLINDKKSDIIILFIIFIILGYLVTLCYFYAYDSLSLIEFSTLSNLEIVIALIFGYFFKEKITLNKIIGSITIIIGIILKSYSKYINTITI